MENLKRWIFGGPLRRRQTTTEERDIALHLSKIDKSRFLAIRDKYIDVDPYPGFSKYLQLERYLRTALAHYELAGLRGKPDTSVLDIGTGPGYFPFVCRNLGHFVESIDLPGQEFYREMTDLLGIEPTAHRIKAFELLPSLTRKFDLITAFAVCFNGHATGGLWGAQEWEFFVSDLRAHLANPGAGLFLKLNREPNGEFCSCDVHDYFLSQGATVHEDMIRLKLWAVL